MGEPVRIRKQLGVAVLIFLASLRRGLRAEARVLERHPLTNCKD
jgi:hypothetical protein